MNHTYYARAEGKVRVLYDKAYSSKYRQSDNEVVRYPEYSRICDILKELSSSFDHKISALDLGCGSGRYFNCLSNTKELVGLDVSSFVLEEAKNPVLKSTIDITSIDLVCGNVFDARFSPNSFDLIYSLGVLGEHSPFDLRVCNRLFEILNPGGKLFFTVVDISSKFSGSLKKKAFAVAYNLLPKSIRRSFLKESLNVFYLEEEEIKDIMKQSLFDHYEISTHQIRTKHWQGGHFECLANKQLL